MILEICASNYQSAINAQEAGAQRIELCSELAIGGITPSYGLIKQTVKALSIPVFVLIRPRSGNFTYTDSEFEIMKRNIQLCKDLGCSGIVSGVLNEDNTIDVKRTQELIEITKPLPFTFHRAFDWTPNPSEAIKQLITIGADRVLTSGQESSAEQGLSLLSSLKAQVEDKIIILPGGGINSDNIIHFKINGFSEAHASATTIAQINKQPKVAMNSSKFFDETVSVISDRTKMKAILNTIKD
jgi:copper homeostasis protein